MTSEGREEASNVYIRRKNIPARGNNQCRDRNGPAMYWEEQRGQCVWRAVSRDRG